MRLIAVAAIAAALSAASASAAGIALNLDDSAQNAAAQLPSMLDNCVASLMLRNDPTICRGMSMWVTALSNEVRNAQVTAAKKAAEDAARKAAEDAAKKQPEHAVPVEHPETAAPE